MANAFQLAPAGPTGQGHAGASEKAGFSQAPGSWPRSGACRVTRLTWDGSIGTARTRATTRPSGGPALARRPREEWVLIPVPAIVSDRTFEATQQAARDNAIFSPRGQSPARSCSGASCAVATAGSRKRSADASSAWASAPPWRSLPKGSGVRCTRRAGRHSRERRRHQSRSPFPLPTSSGK